ncbi:CoA transferase [Eionea flava]
MTQTQDLPLTELPFKNLRVVDFGQQIVGPAVAMILADFGATVVHIDPPQGPAWVDDANAILNRNKLCITIDLNTEVGQQQALALIEQADIVIESFRPGVMQSLGIDFQKLRQKQPDLITLSTPGFSSNDELRRDWKATEAIVAATCGAYTDMGFNRVLMGINPSFSPLPLGSSYATSLAASAAVLALYQREKTGLGDHIEVPIAAALMEGLSYNSYTIENLPERYRTMREQEIERRKANNIPLDMGYEELQEYLDPFYRTYDCADGRKFYCVCPSHRNHAERCLKLMGIYDELIEMGLPDVEDLYVPISEWSGETSIGVYPLTEKWANIVAEKMKVAFLSKTSEEWGVLFGEHQIPGSPHRTTHEWVNDKHCLQSKLIVEVNDPVFGNMKQPGPVAWLEEFADQMVTPRPRQYVDFDHAINTLAEIAKQEVRLRPAITGRSTQNNPPQQKQGWLDGLKVLDLTNVIAGPHSTAYLGRFGAEVIKVDPITPVYDPLIGTIYAFQTGLGKKSILLDIMSTDGREAFNRLLKTVDLVVINAPERQLAQLNLDEASLQTVNPGVLFCRLDCFGGPHIGSKSNYIGYDDIIQSNSGIMSRFGGNDTPEEHAHIGTLDVNCGFAAAISIGVALFQKHRTGQVTRARTSLSAVTNIAQIPFAYDYEGKPPANEASGREALGNHELSHFYQTQDSWVIIDSNPSELKKLEQVDGLEGISQTANIKTFLSHAFMQQTSDYWANELRKHDIAIAEPKSIEWLRDNNSRIQDNQPGTDKGSFAFSIYPDHPSGHCVTYIDPYAIRPTEASINSLSPTEKFGASTVTILESLNYSEEEIETLLNNRAAGLRWSREYLPS